MQERELRQKIEEVRNGSLPRRSFIQQMVGLGLTAPMASMMLMHEGIAQTRPAIPYKPTKRGGGGTLKLIWWQGAGAPEPALRRRHQGPGRQRASSTSRWPAGTPKAT
jgi:peptide/nickel transport system substrate-binding protein